MIASRNERLSSCIRRHALELYVVFFYLSHGEEQKRMTMRRRAGLVGVVGDVVIGPFPIPKGTERLAFPGVASGPLPTCLGRVLNLT
jgi:hypothetical protein